MHPSSDRRALAVLIFGACMIGLGPVLVRLARAEHVGPAGSAFWRVTLALPILAAMILRGRKAGVPGPSLKPTWIAAFAGFLFAGDLVCWNYGIRFTAIAKATVLSVLASSTRMTWSTISRGICSQVCWSVFSAL